jgi:hypothetical protein
MGPLQRGHVKKINFCCGVMGRLGAALSVTMPRQIKLES